MNETVFQYPDLTYPDHLLLIFPQLRELSRRFFAQGGGWARLDWPELARFFQAMKYEFRTLYSLLDQVKASTGRPPYCQHFQLRFVVFTLLAGFSSFREALDYVNQTPEWQHLLGRPPKRYWASTLSRFLARIPEATWQLMEAALVRKLLWRNVLSLHTLAIDTFPIISQISTQKALGVGQLDWSAVLHWFQILDLSALQPFFKQRRTTPYSPLSLVTMWIFQHLWGIPSKHQVYRLVAQTPVLRFLWFGPGPFPSYYTYGKFTAGLLARPDWPLLQACLVTCLTHQPGLAGVGRSWEDWQGLLGTHHALKDPGAQLNQCASKHLTYLGRGGTVLVDSATELPLVGWVQAQVRLSRQDFQRMMQQADALLPPTARIAYLVGDGEFDSDANADACEGWLGAHLVRPVTERSGQGQRLPPAFYLQRLPVERLISRLGRLPQMQRPPVRTTLRVASYIHAGLLSLQLVALYSVKLGQPDQCRSLHWIQRRL